MNIIEWAKFRKMFCGVPGGNTPEASTLKAGLYQTGAIDLYNEQGAEAIEGMMIKSWDELVAEGVVGVEDGMVYTSLDYDEWVSLSSDALDGDLMLPADGSVTKIGAAHYDEEADEAVGNFAFCGCKKLTGIIIPDGATAITPCAFHTCTSLTRVIIPKSVTTIGTMSFEGCEMLTDVLFEKDSQLTTIEVGAFASCIELTDIIIPNNVSIIGSYAFANCAKFTSIVIPAGTVTLGGAAFNGCTNLESVTFAEGSKLSTIDAAVFGGCETLKNIVIPADVTSIEFHAFGGCTGLISVTIPNSVTSIGEGAFSVCTSLTSLTFEGTIAQWNSISLGEYWNENVPATYVQCSDGTVSLT